MALIRIELFSRCLMRTVPVTAVVPVDNVRYEGEPQRPIGLPVQDPLSVEWHIWQ